MKVVELFAGVGGFRLGLEGWDGKSPSSNYSKLFNSPYKVIWSNQWEPSTKTQHASNIYEQRFGSDGHNNCDISTVDVQSIPDHDLLVGGFPCQDYSVATTLKNSKGLLGKKGVLWWNIHQIVSEKKPKYLLFENVDRLLISPSNQKGKDFAIILKSLIDLGYFVEWRVINAADYGMPQKRKRVFILAYHNESKIGEKLKRISTYEWMVSEGTLAKAFPVEKDIMPTFTFLDKDITEISESFQQKFENTGVVVGNVVFFAKTTPVQEKQKTLSDIIESGDVDEEFYINGEELERWKYLKGAKKEIRKKANGFEYHYHEGKMSFPDALDKPSRTIITGEGGKAPSRFKHVIETENGYRRLTPVELERLNMFPDNHTRGEKTSNTKRAFFMGNALVVGIIERIGIELNKKI